MIKLLVTQCYLMFFVIIRASGFSPLFIAMQWGISRCNVAPNIFC